MTSETLQPNNLNARPGQSVMTMPELSLVTEDPPATGDWGSVYYWRLADKRLRLFVGHCHVATTHLESVPGVPKLTGATTALYLKAKERMQELANSEGAPVKYNFSTSFESMRIWAKPPQKGRGLFNWELEYDPDRLDDNLHYYYEATTTIHPLDRTQVFP